MTLDMQLKSLKLDLVIGEGLKQDCNRWGKTVCSRMGSKLAPEEGRRISLEGGRGVFCC